jgi:hypothetical protein
MKATLVPLAARSCIGAHRLFRPDDRSGRAGGLLLQGAGRDFLRLLSGVYANAVQNNLPGQRPTASNQQRRLQRRARIDDEEQPALQRSDAQCAESSSCLVRPPGKTRTRCSTISPISTWSSMPVAGRSSIPVARRRKAIGRSWRQRPLPHRHPKPGNANRCRWSGYQPVLPSSPPPLLTPPSRAALATVPAEAGVMGFAEILREAFLPERGGSRSSCRGNCCRKSHKCRA